MARKFLGIAYLVFGYLCLYFSSYWFFAYTEQTLRDLIQQYSFFTNQSVVLCSIYCLGVGVYYLGYQKIGPLIFNCYIKVAVTTYILMVGLGYYIGVARFYFTSWDELYVVQPQSIFMHLITPIIMGLIYNTTPLGGKFEASKSVFLMVYPLLYLIYANLYSIVTDTYIYPILDPQIMGQGLAIPLATVAGCILFWLIGFFVAARHNFCLENQQERKA